MIHKSQTHAVSTLPAAMVLLLLFLLSACGPALSTRATSVRMVTVNQIYEIEKQCEFLGNVRGSALFSYCCFFSWSFLRDTYYAGALNELLDHAAELGASHVFVNKGDGPYLIGEAFFCAFCMLPDGLPDDDFCMGPDGRRDMGFCADGFGGRVGLARCEGAEGKNAAECEENGGTWIPAIDQPTCEKQGHAWMPEAADPASCEQRGGKWNARATNKHACEAKGGRWLPNRDILRAIPDE